MLGWKVYFLSGISDATLSTLFGLSRCTYINDEEKEHPALIAVVVPNNSTSEDSFQSELTKEVIEAFDKGIWLGKNNTVSYGHSHWELMHKINDSTVKLSDEPSVCQIQLPEFNLVDIAICTKGVLAGPIIRKRRSALDLNGKPIKLECFQQFLLRLSPACSVVPWSFLGELRYNVNIGFYVYGVEGLAAGYYVLIRNPSDKEQIEESTKEKNFKWSKAPSLAPEIPFYLLEEKEATTVAATAAKVSLCIFDNYNRFLVNNR